MYLIFAERAAEMKLLMETASPVKKLKKPSSEKKKRSLSSKSESKPKRIRVSESDKETTASEGAAALNITKSSESLKPVDPTERSKDSVLTKKKLTAMLGGNREKTYLEQAVDDPSSFFSLYEGLSCPLEDQSIRLDVFDPKDFTESQDFYYHQHAVSISKHSLYSL